ncbi:hypothetical protein O6H91_11G013400 [Diphasiastrum complanatum]|uniref:Uncharacterized protein n=1 Tax=Diphasiastrum complanatum TaxID=34168 RepID=A0ACC2C6H5_DIPCM|nr:hypothetical protein O6H91_Y060100 [Diphasiastrum complanatum]KAJ7537606.1 hypothetical protein O6H91_11G013400 [Diphasiastrum complanatum]
MVCDSHRLELRLFSILVVVMVMVYLSAMSEGRPHRAANAVVTQMFETNAPIKSKSLEFEYSSLDECIADDSNHCSPPIDNSVETSKRLVPTGPNPLHNR